MLSFSFAQVTDLNDNHPVFEKESYTSIIPEEATPGKDHLDSSILHFDHDANLTGLRKHNRSNLNQHKALQPRAISPLDYRQMVLIETEAL